MTGAANFNHPVFVGNILDRIAGHRFPFPLSRRPRCCKALNRKLKTNKISYSSLDACHGRESILATEIPSLRIAEKIEMQNRLRTSCLRRFIGALSRNEPAPQVLP